MKRLLGIVIGFAVLVVVCVAVTGAWFVWKLHPWVPAGHALALGNWRFGDFEFQVWQRKNADIFEPFADGLFVRRGTNQWQAFCFDIQDRYSPRVRLTHEQGRVVVYRDDENRGVYDVTTQTFRRHGEACTPEGMGNSTSPPGQWWLR